MANAYMLSGYQRFAAGLGVVVVAAALSGCVPVDRPQPWSRLASVELSKQDVARLRDRGVISCEEATRREFAIERSAYALSDRDLDTWNLAILYARQYDARRLDRASYRQLTSALFADYGKRR